MLMGVDGLRIKRVSDGAVLFLPVPSFDAVSIEWAEKATTRELLDGSDRTRVVGYVPAFTAKWRAYDDRPMFGKTRGTANGQCPKLEDLLVLISGASGRWRVSPGLSAGGFLVDRCEVKPLGKQGRAYTDVQITFKSREIFPTRTLGAF
jgi:hypothetical protein